MTGHNQKGESIISDDQLISSVKVPGLPGVSVTELWGADKTLEFPDDGKKPETQNFFPPIGGFRFVELTIPGKSTAEKEAGMIGDKAEAMAACEALFPGILGTRHPEVPGLHRSEGTADLLYIMEGNIVLELDDGSQTPLTAGDTVVQNATMFAWRNHEESPCRILAVAIGSHWQP